MLTTHSVMSNPTFTHGPDLSKRLQTTTKQANKQHSHPSLKLDSTETNSSKVPFTWKTISWCCCSTEVSVPRSPHWTDSTIIELWCSWVMGMVLWLMARVGLTLRRPHCKRPLTIVRWTWLRFLWMRNAPYQSQSRRSSRTTSCTWDQFQDLTHGDIQRWQRCWHWLGSSI